MPRSVVFMSGGRLTAWYGVLFSYTEFYCINATISDKMMHIYFHTVKRYYAKLTSYQVHNDEIRKLETVM